MLGHGARFGDAVNQTVVFPTEYESLQREYVILFRRDPDGAYRSVVLLGLDAQDNVFLRDGSWQARYVPGLMQRGPFSIGVPERGADGAMQGEPMIHVDLDHPRISRDEGEPVFLPHGGNAPYLDHVAGVLQSIYVGSEASRAMFAAFEEHGLIEPIALDISLDDGRRYDVPDCFTIGQQALRDLDARALDALHRADFLRAAIWVAGSLANLGALVERKRQAVG